MKLIGNELEYFLESIPGVMVINMDGIVVYISQLCSEYFSAAKEDVLGKHVLEVFPSSKMVENLYSDSPCVVYYHSSIGIGISAQVPLFMEDRRVGLLEYDLLQNPHILYEFPVSYSRFLDRELKNIQHKIRNSEGTKYSIDSIRGRSKAISALKDEIIVAARTNSAVLITGETGTGKEMVAQAIHDLSARRGKKIVTINAATLPDNLIESELFGYSEGAFTGASRGGKKGRFEQADKSTLFIDEINRLPLGVQPKLLRVLQEKEVDPVGSDKSVPVDVRIIAATNRDLEEMVVKHEFLEDLFYRINVLTITVPPLRERLCDIPDLVEARVRDLNHTLGKNIERVDPLVYKMMEDYDWPGNVRELFNMLEKAMNYATGKQLTPEEFDWRKEKMKSAIKPGRFETRPIDAVRDEAERELILQVLDMCQGNKSKAAKYLEINRTLLYQKMKRLGIDE